MDDETFLDDEIYDDDAPEYHPVDDLMDAAEARTRALSTGDDAESDADLDIAVLGNNVASMDLAPASCFTPAHLSELAGCDVASLRSSTFLEMRADATEDDLSAVGRLMPRLAQLRANTSIVPTMRAFGSTFQNLKVLWIARSDVSDLSGIASLVSLAELYASFNEVQDVSPLAELDHLVILDLEGNRIEDEDAPEYLNMCPKLISLSLEGNPVSRQERYRNTVCAAMKRLASLDDVPVTERDRYHGIDAPESEGHLDGGSRYERESASGEPEREPEDCLREKREANGDADASSREEKEKEKEKAARFAELDIVTDGIKYAAVGIDDPDAVTARDESTGELSVTLAEASLGTAMDAEPFAPDDCARRGDAPSPGNGFGAPPPPSTTTGVVLGRRPGTARALARANSLGASVRGTLGNGIGRVSGARPGTAVTLGSSGGFGSRSGPVGPGSGGGGSAAGSRPSTAASWSATRSASRPGTASFSRPGTARSWGSGAGSRPGTAASLGAGGRGDDASRGDFGRLACLFWRKNEQKESRAGLANDALGGTDRTEDADRDFDSEGHSSALTRGEGMLVGNPAKVLSRRKRQRASLAPTSVAASPERSREGPEVDEIETVETVGDPWRRAHEEEDILDQLRRWKIEMAETFSRLAEDGRFSNRGTEETALQSRTFTPRPPSAPKPAPPKFAPQPPGGPGGPRRPPGRAAGVSARAVRTCEKITAKSAFISVGDVKNIRPDSGVVMRRQNPRPNSARTEREVDRLVL
jgi:hypothetical protein